MRRSLVLSLSALPAAGQAQPAESGAEAWAPPRTSDGHPDLQGIWQALNTAAWDLQDHGGSLGVPAGQGVVVGGEIPYQPWALEQKQRNFENRATADPEARLRHAGGAAHHLHALPVPDSAVLRPGAHPLRVRPRHPDGVHGRDAASRGAHRLLDGRLPRTVGGGHAGGRRDPLQRRDVVRPGRQLPQHRAARRGALHPPPAPTTCCTKPPSRTRRCSPGRGPSACRSTGRQEAGVQLLEYECYAYAEEDLAVGARPDEAR